MLKTLYFKDYRNKTVFKTFIYSLSEHVRILFICAIVISHVMYLLYPTLSIFISYFKLFKSFALIAHTTDGVAVEILNQRVNVIVDHTCCMIIDIC